jgi:hypothetical protein
MTRKWLQLVCSVAIGVVLLGGSAEQARAECAPGDRIFVDPRLVPGRPHITYEQLLRIWGVPGGDPNYKMMIYKQYLEQNQPIQIPLNGGVVLISPINPCIQQYIER